MIALDPETGKERWVYDPRVDRGRFFPLVTSRGVSTWLDPSRAAGDVCRRIFVATIDARLIALDAALGAPCGDFGRDGTVELKEGIAPSPYLRCCYQVTSPPAVVGSLIVVGSTIGDNITTAISRGVVRAYDARTGALRWSWDPIPSDSADPATGTWQGESWRRTGAANAWAPISADAERGLVFVPTSSPSPDHYGGERLGANLYANAVWRCARRPAKVVWHFQVVHHDLWDYDVPAQPTLLTFTRRAPSRPGGGGGDQDGTPVRARSVDGRAALARRGAGRPEKYGARGGGLPHPAVPGSAGPSMPQRLTPDDAWGADAGRPRVPAATASRSFGPRASSRLRASKGSVVFPGLGGGMHWGGVSHDPIRGLLIVNTTRLAFMVQLIPRGEYARTQAAARAAGRGRRIRAQHGTPYGMYREVRCLPLGARATRRRGVLWPRWTSPAVGSGGRSPWAPCPS